MYSNTIRRVQWNFRYIKKERDHMGISLGDSMLYINVNLRDVLKLMLHIHCHLITLSH